MIVWRRRSTFVMLGACAALVACVAWPWLRPDLDWSKTADGENHLTRIYLFYLALKGGEWFPRWLPELYLGYGYPLFNFYAPGTYYLAAALHALRVSISASLQWIGILAVLLGASGTYLLAKSIYAGRQDAALLASAAYVLAPYPFFINLYGRGQVPEALALGLLPWMLMAAWGTWTQGGKWAWLLAVLTASVVLTHNITSFLAAGLVIALVMALLSLSRQRDVPVRTGIRRIGTALAVGLGLSAFFWLPMLTESRYVHLGKADVSVYLFDPPALARSTASTSFIKLLSTASAARYLVMEATLGLPIPERISIPQLLLWLGAVVGAGAGLTRRYRTWSLFWAAIALLLWLLNTTWSSWLWQEAPLLSIMQYPWRLYGPLSLCIALAAAGWLAAGSDRRIGIHLMRAFAALCIGILAIGSIAARPFSAGSLPNRAINGEDLFAREVNQHAGGTTSTGEFLPKTVAIADYTPGIKRGIAIYDDALSEAGWQAGYVRVLDGNAAISGVYRRPNRIMADVVATEAAVVAFHQLLFPGWRGSIGGRATPVGPVPFHERLQASLGYMVINVPAGTHRVEVRFGSTPVRTVAIGLSTATLVLCVWRLGWPLSIARLRSTFHMPLLRGDKSTKNIAWILLPFMFGCAVAGGVVGWDTLRARSGLKSHEVNRIVLDFADLVASSRADTRTPAANGRGSLPPFLTVGFFRIGDESRRWLYMHPPSEVVAHVDVPPHAYFQAGLACDPQTWWTDYGDGVRFIVEVEGRTGKHTILDRHVNPRARVEERRWVDVWSSLAAVANQSVRMVLRTDPAQDLSYDWCGWANPQIIIWDSPRPHPGTLHSWQQQ
ncbi:MAG: hypothetical protein HY332_15105 [Chloroflexi bacterium]|nr:hypothetical protein [Chloroflexota bacterium]